MTHPSQLLKQAGIYAGKELGQNFLSDPGVARMIVERAGISNASHVLEIGPGLGALTLHLAKTAGQVTVVEKDSRLIPLLQQELARENLDQVRVIRQDILRQDIRKLAENKKLVVISNLPYNISSQVLIKLIEERTAIEKAVLMFQKEMADRIVAPPGGREYSRLSVMAQYAAVVSNIVRIGPASFFPRPDVHSSVLMFDFVKDSDFSADQERLMFDVVKAAFSKRRKSLKNSLSGGELGMDKQKIQNILKTAVIDDKRRAETLCVEEFKRLVLVTEQVTKEKMT